ncbi:hypothetical protein BT96DRAFT_702237 [Gymnopus androsaceus JB14]|uniref:ZZ-type domain-containing protein n=1 Tax=Gymnopus androsaceus JB14 TaxID=1447944 RepID=A0A6A4HMA6_9AGAR|nr:hypothetical protein BT96DRAFT_702237 [Gymnopus androsaceus JB14]
MVEFRVHTWKCSGVGKFQLRGNGSYSQGTISINGIATLEQQYTLEAHLKASPDYKMDQAFEIILHGTLDNSSGQASIVPSLPPQYTMSGEWGYTSESNTNQICGDFYFSQTPTWAHHFKSQIVESTSPNGARTRVAGSLWKFACSVVRHQVYSQKQLLCTETVREMLGQLRRGAELSRYQYLINDKPLNDSNQAEMNRLLLVSPPWTSRFYRSVARSRFDWATLHYGCLCTICDTVILGTRFDCFTCISDSKSMMHSSFCSKCRHAHDAFPTLGHSLVKMKMFAHMRDMFTLKMRAFALSTRPLFHNFTPSTGIPFLSPGASFVPSSPFNTQKVRFNPSVNEVESSTVGGSSSSHLDLSLEEQSGKTSPIEKPSIVSSGPSTDESVTDEEKISSKPNQRHCASCRKVVDLSFDVYWVCLPCSDPNTHTYIVICTECPTQVHPGVFLSSMLFHQGLFL